MKCICGLDSDYNKYHTSFKKIKGTFRVENSSMFEDIKHINLYMCPICKTIRGEENNVNNI